MVCSSYDCVGEASRSLLSLVGTILVSGGVGMYGSFTERHPCETCGVLYIGSSITSCTEKSNGASSLFDD